MELTTELKREIFDLITLTRDNRQNRRMFELYNQMSGRSRPVRVCNCSSKIDMIKKFFHNLLIENEFVS